MIIIEGGAPAPCERRTLKSMFAARKQVFVDLLGWDLPVLDGRYEVDAFDDAHAIYIIVADDGGEHLGSARLLPTRRAHILGDLFPALCAGPVPRGDDIFEITRFCLGRNQGAARRRETRNRLVSALVRFALEARIATYTGVAELRWLQQILAFGWECRPLGPPRHIAGALTGALAISITPDTPALLESSGIWTVERTAGGELADAA